MELKNCNILLIGAAGGIGRHLSLQLLDRGANMLLTSLTEEELAPLQLLLRLAPPNYHCLAADITDAGGRQNCVDTMLEHFGGIDMLINLAGIGDFSLFEQQTPEMIEKIIQVNTIAPMLMTHAVLPQMRRQGQGQIVNIGSTFGSIGFSCFTTYSTSKFALRGFSQALRRELVGSGIQVTYVAPRAVHTPLNSPAVYAMAEAIKMQFDSPEEVAKEIVKAIVQDKKEHYIGFPESFFARINGILPGLVDNSLKKQNPAMLKYAQQQ